MKKATRILWILGLIQLSLSLLWSVFCFVLYFNPSIGQALLNSLPWQSLLGYLLGTMGYASYIVMGMLGIFAFPIAIVFAILGRVYARNGATLIAGAVFHLVAGVLGFSPMLVIAGIFHLVLRRHTPTASE